MDNMHITAPLASFAPLNRSWLCHITRYRLRTPQAGLSFDEVRLHATREVIDAIHRHGVLTTTLLCDLLTTISPSGPKVDRDLLWRWKRKGAIRYIDERPSLHSAIALMIGRSFHRAAKGWCPSMLSQEPLFWCWVELPGSSTRYMGAYPFIEDAVYLHLPTSNDTCTLPDLEQARIRNLSAQDQEVFQPGWYRLPPATLLYSAYTGLAHREDGSSDPRWLAVNGGGVIRFWDEGVSLADLTPWQQEVIRLDQLPEEQIPDVVQTMRILTLQLLACERIPRERQTVPAL